MDVKKKMFKEILKIIHSEHLVTISKLKDQLNKDEQIIRNAINLLVEKKMLDKSYMNVSCEGCTSCDTVEKKCILMNDLEFLGEDDKRIKFFEITNKGLEYIGVKN
jgi:hypothetical protein